MAATADTASPGPGGLALAAGVLGFALGGFFDGILLHQVLQWHHFLSLVGGEALRDIRTQILWDGLFHVAVYLIAFAGLLLLFRARGGLGAGGAGRRLLVAALAGFGVWQFADVVLFHWIVGIHRIRVDVPNPLLWDVGWLVVFGVPPLVAAWWLHRRPGGAAGGGATLRGGAVAAALALAVLGSAPVAALGPRGDGPVLVLFRPGTGAADAFAAVAAVDGRVAWSDPSGELLAVDLGPGRRGWGLYGRGALLVGSTPAAGGCLGWSRVAAL